jgi:beta-lactamase superfamily II metal-dependent hydrolase
LAAWCRPQWIVLSGDGRWSTPETAATYRAVGGQILHTHIDGAITVKFDEREVKVEAFIKPKEPNKVRPNLQQSKGVAALPS